MRRPEALRRAQQRAEVAGIGDSVELKPDLGLRGVAHERRKVVGADHADGAARVRERRERLHDLGGAAVHLAAGGEELLGDAVGAEIVVHEHLDGHDTGGERGAERILALVDEQPGALALLGLAEPSRSLDTSIRTAGDHAGTPLSAATGAHAGCAATVSVQVSRRGCPASAPA